MYMRKHLLKDMTNSDLNHVYAIQKDYDQEKDPLFKTHLLLKPLYI